MDTLAIVASEAIPESTEGEPTSCHQSSQVQEVRKKHRDTYQVVRNYTSISIRPSTVFAANFLSLLPNGRACPIPMRC